MVHRVLIAVDGTEASRTALELACALVDDYEASLDLVSVLKPEAVTEDLVQAAEIEGVVPRKTSYCRHGTTASGEYTGSTVYGALAHTEKVQRVATVIADKLVAQAEAVSKKKPFKSIETIVRSGDPAKAILEVASERGTDVIILGQDRKGRLQSLFTGNVAEKVQREATCQCLVFSQPQKH